MFLLRVLIGILGFWALAVSANRASQSQQFSGSVVLPGLLGIAGITGSLFLPMGQESAFEQVKFSVAEGQTKPGASAAVFASGALQPMPVALALNAPNASVPPVDSTMVLPILRCEKYFVNGKEQKDITVQIDSGTFAVNGTARTRASQKGWQDGKNEFDPPVLLKYLNDGLARCDGGAVTATAAKEVPKTASVPASETTGEKMTVTGLVLAARKGDLPTIQRYIDGKFNLNSKTPKGPSQYELGTTAVVTAAAEGKCDALNLLLNGGAKPDIDQKVGFTPLFLAASAGHTECVRLLLAKKARVDVRTEVGGDTALITAAYMGHFDVVKLLVQAGANRKAVNKDNDNALAAARAFGNNSIVRYLSSL